jgi:hypothetical protein
LSVVRRPIDMMVVQQPVPLHLARETGPAGDEVAARSQAD